MSRSVGSSNEAQPCPTSPQQPQLSHLALQDHHRSSSSSNSGSTLLLGLPDVVQREVFSWCPDAASAVALLNTCRALRRLRNDPTAMALLLLRCNIAEYGLALHACSPCHGGVCPVVRQVLRLVQAGPDSGGPHPASPLLLYHMLVASASEGDAATVRSLLALPDAPNVNARRGAAFMAALQDGPHLPVLSALLEHGADPMTSRGHIISFATGLPRHAPALALLLQHYRGSLSAYRNAVVTDTSLAMRRAIILGNLAAVAVLLPAITAAGWHLGSYVTEAARTSRCGVLGLLVSCREPSIQASLPEALLAAVTAGAHDCATLLLEHGVDVNAASVAGGSGLPLLVAVRAAMSANAGYDRCAMVRLLRRHGAVVTPAVQEAAGDATLDAILAAAAANATLQRCGEVSSLLQPGAGAGGDSAGGCHKCVIA